MAKRVTPSVLTARLHRREAAAVRELEQRLKDAQRQVAAKIERAAERRTIATSRRTREGVQHEISNVYVDLNKGIDEWLHDLTEKTATEWHQVAVEEIKRKGGKKRLALAFNRERVRRYWEIIHPDNTSNLAAVFTDKMEESDKRHLRQAFLNTFREQTLEGLTAKETHKRLQQRWDAAAKNLRGDRFVDASGRTWTNAQYLQMLTRTTLQTVHRESYTDTLLENGFDLARISDDGDPCPICRAWAGVIISMTGKTKGYPTLQQARDSGWGHPNCMCRPEYLDETVDADEIARQHDERTPEPPAVDPDDPAYREKMKEYVAEVQEYNDGIRIQAKVDDGMNADEALTDLKRDKLKAQMRHAMPDLEDKQDWVDEIPAGVLAKIDKNELPRIEPAKKSDTPNSSRDSRLGGVLKLARDSGPGSYLKAFAELEEKRGVPVLPDTDETAEPTGPKVFVKAFKRVTEAFGDRADIQNTDSPVVRQHVSDLAKTMGDDTLKKLAAKGVRIQIADTGVGNLPGAESFADKVPRGWAGIKNSAGEQATWRDLAGGYFPGDKTVRLGSGMSGSVNTAAHEGAHAMGDTLGLNDAPELIEHHKRLFEKLKDYEQQDGPGGYAGRQEMLAEAAARLRVWDEKKVLTWYDKEFIVWLKKVLKP